MNKNRMKTHLKDQVARTRVFKEDSQGILRDNGGIHTREYHDYLEELSRLRAMFLAYGFLGGKPYRVMEPRAYSEPNWRTFREITFEFGGNVPYISGGWNPRATELLGGVPSSITDFLKGEMDRESWREVLQEKLRSPLEEPIWYQLSRQTFPIGEAPGTLEMYLQMEDWIQEAREYQRRSLQGATS